MRGDGDELDSEAILKQGDELLRSSRALLDDLDDLAPPPEETDETDEPDEPAEPQRDQA